MRCVSSGDKNVRTVSVDRGCGLDCRTGETHTRRNNRLRATNRNYQTHKGTTVSQLRKDA